MQSGFSYPGTVLNGNAWQAGYRGQSLNAHPTFDREIVVPDWNPILSPSDKATPLAVDAINEIARAITAKDYRARTNGAVREQNYDEALLYGYLAVAYDDLHWAGLATDCLNTAIERASQRTEHPGLYGGLTGLGWTIEHLSHLLGSVPASVCDLEQLELQENEDEDLNAEIDLAVLRQLEHSDSSACYDLISGLVGFGTYFLERCPKGVALQGINSVFEKLEGLAIQTNAGITWFSGPELLPEWQRQQCPQGYYNLGVAHGIPGVIHFLNEVSGTDLVEPARSNKLLQGAVNWLIAQQRPGESRSCFAPWIVPGGEISDSRLGWCYGDLGILAVLLQVSRRGARNEWSNFANNLLDRCLAWPPEETQVADACLCHGAIGVAHIFNRIYQSLGDPRCRTAALSWYYRALAMRRPDTGVGGFSALMRPDPKGPSVWEPSPAFLDGAGGIALGLLAAITKVPPQWDRLLLLSGRDFT